MTHAANQALYGSVEDGKSISHEFKTDVSGDGGEDTQPLISSSGHHNPTAKAGHGSKQLSGLKTFSVSINSIIGTGVFALPFAFYKAGSIFGTVSLFLGGLFGYFALLHLLESISMCFALTRHIPKELQIKLNELRNFRTLSDAQQAGNNAGAELFDLNSGAFPIHYDYTKMFKILFNDIKRNPKAINKNNSLAIINNMILMLFSYGVLWSYTAVFSNSVASMIFMYGYHEQCDVNKNPSDSCRHAYYIIAAVYAVSVTTLTMFELSETATMQAALTIYRFIALSVLLSSVIAAMFIAPAYSNAVPETSPPYLASDMKFWDMNGFTILTSGAVALAVHQIFPEIVYANKNNSNRRVKGIMASVVTTSVTFYIVVAALCSIYFGSQTNDIVTLNWQDYNGTFNYNSSIVPWWSIMIRFIIMLMPIFDTFSVFPVIALTLASNYEAIFGTFLKKRLSEVNERRLTRILSCIPPLIGGFLYANIDSIFSYVGLAAFIMTYYIPAFLLVRGRQVCRQIYGEFAVLQNPYGGFPNNWLGILWTVTFGSFCFILSIYARTTNV